MKCKNCRKDIKFGYALRYDGELVEESLPICEGCHNEFFAEPAQPWGRRSILWSAVPVVEVRMGWYEGWTTVDGALDVDVTDIQALSRDEAIDAIAASIAPGGEGYILYHGCAFPPDAQFALLTLEQNPSAIIIADWGDFQSQLDTTETENLSQPCECFQFADDHQPAVRCDMQGRLRWRTNNYEPTTENDA